MPDRTSGANGSMILSSHWHEDNSGYNDETTTIEKLQASDDGRAVLLIHTRETSTLSGETSHSETYSIPVGILIKLIQREGTRIGRAVCDPG